MPELSLRAISCNGVNYLAPLAAEHRLQQPLAILFKVALHLRACKTLP